MSRYLSFKRLAVLFAGLFALSVTATLVFQSYWVEPGERCEAEGGWWDLEGRTCARPIYIPDITGRPAGVSRAEASDAGNRELLSLERQAREQGQ
jgi:hypothetical protein